MFKLFSFSWKIIDILFPPRCAGCGAWGYRFCPCCYQNVILMPEPQCTKCGDKLDTLSGSLCKRCIQFQPLFTEVRSSALYQGGLQSAIHSLKYKGDLGLGESLAAFLLDEIKEQSWKIDLVTCVPLDKQRYKERGYNQSEHLSRPLAHQMGKPFYPQAIRRNRRTRSQVGLSIYERKHNVDRAFTGDRKIVSGKSVLIVDDVITTGATLSSCASALVIADAENVYGITLARAERLLEE